MQNLVPEQSCTLRCSSVENLHLALSLGKGTDRMFWGYGHQLAESVNLENNQNALG